MLARKRLSYKFAMKSEFKNLVTILILPFSKVIERNDSLSPNVYLHSRVMLSPSTTLVGFSGSLVNFGAPDNTNDENVLYHK